MRVWRGRVGRSVIVDAVSEMCRDRSVTHVLMSSETYQVYVSGLTQHHRRAGIKAATCHAVAILPVEGMVDDWIFSFNYRRARAGENLLSAVRSEEYDTALNLLNALIDQKESGKAKWLHVCEIPEEEMEEDNETP